MDKKLIIANWKSHKNIYDARIFMEIFSSNMGNLNISNKEIVLAPSFNLLSEVKDLAEKFDLPVSLSAQNISSFPQGAYTGEVSADQLRDLVEWTIIGHSERREYFKEDDEILQQKTNEAIKAGLNIIYCIQNSSQKIPEGVQAVAYEPPNAIGSGVPDSPLHVEKVFEEIKNSFSGKVLYGGSVDKKNVRDYIHINNCDGLLVGGASLDPNSMIELLSQW